MVNENILELFFMLFILATPPTLLILAYYDIKEIVDEVNKIR